MTTVFENQTFEHYKDRGRSVYSDFEFRRCVFTGCNISITRKPRRRSLVRNVRLIECEYVHGAGLSAATVEDVLVDGLRTHELLQTWAMVFKHVTLKGGVGKIMISGAVAPGVASPKEQSAFDEANAAYYAAVDWALDISEAEFAECDIRGIPARLIRRDPATQVVVTREKALEGKWRYLDLSRTYWRQWIELFLSDTDPDVVLVAPKRSRQFQNLLDGLNMLRDAGVAEPD
jgi:hypothetical protein